MVAIEIYGDEGRKGFMPELHQVAASFDRGKTDVFHTSSPEGDIGPLYCLRVYMEVSNSRRLACPTSSTIPARCELLCGPSSLQNPEDRWLLEDVTVRHPATGTEYHFTCGQWIEGDPIYLFEDRHRRAAQAGAAQAGPTQGSEDEKAGLHGAGKPQAAGQDKKVTIAPQETAVGSASGGAKGGTADEKHPPGFLDRAATKIQSVFRGSMGRKEAARQQEKTTSKGAGNKAPAPAVGDGAAQVPAERGATAQSASSATSRPSEVNTAGKPVPQAVAAKGGKADPSPPAATPAPPLAPPVQAQTAAAKSGATGTGVGQGRATQQAGPQASVQAQGMSTTNTVAGRAGSNAAEPADAPAKPAPTTATAAMPGPTTAPTAPAAPTTAPAAKPASAMPVPTTAPTASAAPMTAPAAPATAAAGQPAPTTAPAVNPAQAAPAGSQNKTPPVPSPVEKRGDAPAGSSSDPRAAQVGQKPELPRTADIKANPDAAKGPAGAQGAPDPNAEASGGFFGAAKAKAHEAATSIQSAFRGMTARKRVDEIRKEAGEPVRGAPAVEPPRGAPAAKRQEAGTTGASVGGASSTPPAVSGVRQPSSAPAAAKEESQGVLQQAATKIQVRRAHRVALFWQYCAKAPAVILQPSLLLAVAFPWPQDSQGCCGEESDRSSGREANT